MKNPLFISNMAYALAMDEKELNAIFRFASAGHLQSIYRLRALLGSKKRSYRGLLAEAVNRFGRPMKKDAFTRLGEAWADFKKALVEALKGGRP